MDSQPVFGSSEEYHTWKVLNGRVSDKMLGSILEKIKAGGQVHPAIILSLIDTIQKRPEGISTNMLISLSEKVRPQDISPTMRISEILIEMNEITTAMEILSNSESKDSFHKYLAEAEIYYGQADWESCMISAEKALGYDPSYEKLYEMLDECDPNGNWRDKWCVQAAYEGLESDAPKDYKLRQLYEIYRDWFGGNKDSATDKLVNSDYYKGSEFYFILASARISVDEGDWRSAKMMYDKILEVAPPFVTYEAAEAYLSGHDPSYALELYDELDQTSIRSLKGRIRAYQQLGSDTDMLNSIFDYLDNEYVGSKEYSECIEALIESDKLDEARSLLEDMARSNKNDPSYLVCYAKYLLKNGDVRGARHIALKAVHYGKDDVSAKVLSARIKLISGDVKGAEKDCKKLMSSYPKDKDVLNLRKDILLEKNDLDSALDVCREILESEPFDISTMITLSNAMNSRGDTNGAVMMLRKALDSDPTRDNAIKVVSFMVELGLYREAMYLSYELEKTIPGDAMLRRLRGNAEYNLGEYVKASVSYAAAAEADPHDPVIWHSKGMADEARGDYESAEVSYNRAVLLDLNQSEYWMSKALTQEKFGDLYGAIESLNRAIELDPDSVYPMVRKAVILENAGRYSEALYFVDMCSTTDPSNVNVMILNARVLRESGKIDAAIKKAEYAHELIHSEDSVIELANCYMASGRRSDAIRVIEIAMETNSSSRLRDAYQAIQQGKDEVAQIKLPQSNEEIKKMDPEAAAKIAESMAALGDYRGAIRSIDTALAGSGDDLKYLVMKISYLLKMGDIKESMDLVNEAIKNNPKVAVLHESLGDIKMAKSEYRGALQEYEKAMTMGLNIPDLLVKKGDAQEGLGFYDRSIDSYSMAVNRDPDNRNIRFKLVEKLYSRGYLSRAEDQLEIMLEKNPEDEMAIIMLARVRKDSRKDAGVTDAYRMFRSCMNPSEQAVEKMAAVLESAGHDEEAKSLRRKGPEPIENIKVKRLVEKVLRRSYVSKISPYDDDFLATLGLDDDQIVDVKEYMQRKVEFGEIIPGSPAFQSLERASNDVVLNIPMKDLDKDSDFALEKVFYYANYKDVDDAKRLIAYMEKALVCEIQRDDTLKMVLDRVQGISLYEIMRTCKVGIYQARQIQLLLGIRNY